MHKFFPDWYRVAGIQPDSENVVKRWAGVEAIVANLDTNKALDVARLFLGLTTLSTESKDQFSSAFRKTDPAFPMRDNDLELRVLSAAVAAHYLESQRTAAGDALALALVSGACVDLRPSMLLPEIVTIAKNYIFQEGQKVREHSEVPEIKGIAKGDQLLADAKTTATQNNMPALVDALAAPLQELSATVAKSANDAANHLNNAIATLIEQTNILWWIFAGISRDRSRPYAEIEFAEACLVAGKELADLTELLPGPVAAPAVLDKVLSVANGTTANVSFEAAINTADAGWKQSCISTLDVQLDELCPIHSAFRSSADGSAWIKAFEAVWGIQVKKANPEALALAVQMYNERLLQKAVRK